jgi:hypothetical protein
MRRAKSRLTEVGDGKPGNEGAGYRTRKSVVNEREGDGRSGSERVKRSTLLGLDAVASWKPFSAYSGKH